jgi:hypothetical protein
VRSRKPDLPRMPAFHPAYTGTVLAGVGPDTVVRLVEG